MRRVLLALPLLLLLVFVALVLGQQPGVVVAVAVVSPEKRSVMRVVAQPGAIHPYEEARLHARVAGYVEKVHADIGQRVKAGADLAELAVPELVQEAKAKQALVEVAGAEVKQTREALTAARANATAVASAIAEKRAGLGRTEATRQRWALESTRLTRLVEQGILDAQTRDETVRQYRAAEAAHVEVLARVASAEALAAKAEADVEKAVADVAAAVAQVNVRRAEAARIQALVGFARLTAPFAGVVTRRGVDPGDFVQPTEKSEALFRVAKTDPVRIVIQVPEADAALVTEKSPVELSIPALKGPPIQEKVARTSWSLDPATRTLRVEIDRVNADDRLRPGMYVFARLTQQLPQAWTLPVSAVVKRGENRVCFVIRDGQAVQTPVQTGASDGTWIEVRQLGQAEPTGRETIARDATGLTDGARVKAER